MLFFSVSPSGIVNVTPDDVIANHGENVAFSAETDAGPGTMYFWIYDPTFSLCINDTEECNAITTTSEF